VESKNLFNSVLHNLALDEDNEEEEDKQDREGYE